MNFLGRNYVGWLLCSLILAACGGSAGTSDEMPSVGSAAAGTDLIESPVVNGYFLKTIEVATPHGGVFIRQENSLDEVNNTVTHNYMTQSRGEFVTHTLSTTSYNEIGNPTSKVIEYPRNFPPGDRTTLTYTYNDKGLLSKRTMMSIVGEYEINEEHNYTYNDANAIISREILNSATGALISSEIFEVNSDGKPIKNTKEDLVTVDGVPVESITTYEYDSQRRLVSTTTDTDRSKIDFTYDDNGNIITKVDGYTNGTVEFTKTYTYEPTKEKVFNEIFQLLYFEPHF